VPHLVAQPNIGLLPDVPFDEPDRDLIGKLGDRVRLPVPNFLPRRVSADRAVAEHMLALFRRYHRVKHERARVAASAAVSNFDFESPIGFL